MSHIDVWKLLEDIVENHDPPYCFEPCELEEIRQVRAAHIKKTSKAINKTMVGLKYGR